MTKDDKNTTCWQIHTENWKRSKEYVEEPAISFTSPDKTLGSTDISLFIILQGDNIQRD
jgi:hypothetical protein